MLNTHEFSVESASNVVKEDLGGVNFAWLEITRKCNLECVHCYTDSSPYLDLYGQMTDELWMRVISELASLGCSKIQFIGGEPMLHPSLSKFIAHAKEQGIQKIEVFTNGTVINEKWANFFLSNSVSVATSYYASNALVHEQITKKKGSHKKTNQGLGFLSKVGVPLRVEIIDISGINSDAISQAKYSLSELGVDSIHVDQVRHIGRGRTCETELQKGTCGNCWNHKVCITNTGTIFPCVMSRTTQLGNVLHSSLEDIVESKKTISFRTKYKAQIAHLASCPPSDDCSPDNGACGPDNCSPGDAGEDCGPDTR